MKTLKLIPIALAAFVGGVGALQADKYLDARQETRPVTTFFGSNATLKPVDYEAAPIAAVPVDFREAAKKIHPSVVSVDRIQQMRAGWDDRVIERQSGTGSGVVISEDGLIVTNNHVVDNAQRVKVRFANGESFDAEVLGTDYRSDLAVLKVKAPGLKPIELASSDKVEVGQWVVAVGNPLGFDHTVSVGVVSSLKRNLPIGQQGLVDAIQTDAAINPGNSGGALCDAEGRLIGINTAIASGTGMSVGIGFAIPVDRVKKVVQDIVKYKEVRYPVLGMTYDPRLDGQMGNPYLRRQISEATGATNVPTHGILLGDVSGSAAKAGMKEGDILLEIEGQKIDGSFDLNRVLIPRKPGDVVSVKFWSKGTVKTGKVTLTEAKPTAL